MGKYGGRMSNIQLNSRFIKDPTNAPAYFAALLKRVKKLKLPKDTYLRNIQDEIVALIRQTQYVLSLS